MKKLKVLIAMTFIMAFMGCSGGDDAPALWALLKAPSITSANNTTFTEVTAGTFTVTVTGWPAPTLTLTGSLPDGVTFDAATGVLSGTPSFGTASVYPLTFTASNGVSPNATQSFTLTVNEIPKFVGINYIELEKIKSISKFRSGIGHDYSDDFESCRSMKHYFNPKDSVDSSTIKIFSPVKGTISNIYEESAGTRVDIKSEDYPALHFIIFHINLSNPLNIGDSVTAGQQLGTHIGSATMSDIAVGVNTPSGWKLISYFDVMMDSVFQAYQLRDISLRTDAIISSEERDADPLTCSGETFTNSGTLENWIILN